MLRLTRGARRHIPRNGCGDGQLGRRTITAREVERLQNLHDLLAPFHRQTLAAGLLLWITGRHLAASGAIAGHHLNRHDEGTGRALICNDTPAASVAR
jgi:hypothetical protein